MYYTIYKITNTINGKYYIGKHQTKCLDDNYMGSGKLLKRAIEKYGIENFKKEILHIFNSEKEMNAKEKELVVVCEESYNLNEGGHGGFSYINRIRDHYKHNRAISAKRNYQDPEYRKKVSEIRRKHPPKYVKTERRVEAALENLPRMVTPEANQKRKETFERIKHSQGENNSQYGTCWVNNGIENKKIKKHDIAVWLDNGYVKGRKMNLN